ncbi:hypothetical protein BC834DRAFT_854123 [Gloeopeniophorella convolvens]|nr:hypothetical protein BC834DRAFT_854123 [Gloeopeniophorella convolvens]
MTHAVRPLPPTPPPAPRSMSLEVAELPSSGSSTPSLSDDNSSHPPSEGRVLRSSISLPSISATLNVKFAPLPEIEGRNRKSNYPLGVAARSQMLQHRRSSNRPPAVPRQPPIWKDIEEDPLNPQEEEDPLEAFGKYVADKSKSFWRRVSQKQPDRGTDKPTTQATVGGKRGNTTHRDAAIVKRVGRRDQAVSNTAPREPKPPSKKLTESDGGAVAESTSTRTSTRA